MSKVTIDKSGFDRMMREVRAKNAQWMIESTAIAGLEVAKSMIELASRNADTNRFVRSIEEAAVDIAPYAKQPAPRVRILRPSKRADQFRERLEIAIQRALRQEQRLLGWVKGNEKRPDFNPRWSSHRKLLRDLDKAGNITDAAIQRLEDFDALTFEQQGQAVLVYGQKTTRRRATRIKTTGRNLDRVMHKVYGGIGSVENRGGIVVATITSKEPHARIIDRRYRYKANALAMARSRGVLARRMSRAYIERAASSMGRAA